MIKNINDITLFLKEISKFKDLGGLSKKKLFVLIKKNIELIQWVFSYDEVYDFGITLNLYEEISGKVILTKYGVDILDMYTNDMDLNSEQKKYIVINCIFANKNFKSLLDFLALFTFDQETKMRTLNESDYPIPDTLQISILQQFDVIKKEVNLWSVNPDYIENVELLKEGNDMKFTQMQLDHILEEQKNIGDLAEELTIKYEEDRLRKKGWNDQSKEVRQISKSYVNKGYDIESFSSKSLRPNLFIEVKGRKRSHSSFIISVNEVRTAKKLGKNYAIYFWNNLGSKIIPSSPTRIIIDPYDFLPLTECENCLNYIIDLA